MRYTPFATLFGFLVLALSSALAQTTTPPGTAPGTASTPGAGAGAGAGAAAGGGGPGLVVAYPGPVGRGCRSLVLHERARWARLIRPVRACRHSWRQSGSGVTLSPQAADGSNCIIPKTLLSLSLQYASQPNPGTAILGRATTPPNATARFNSTLDGTTATVRNARWRKVICVTLESEPRNETARRRGGPHVRQSRGISVSGASDPPRQAAFSQAGNAHFWRRRRFADLRTTPVTGLTARRGTHVLLRPDGRRD